LKQIHGPAGVGRARLLLGAAAAIAPVLPRAPRLLLLLLLCAGCSRGRTAGGTVASGRRGGDQGSGSSDLGFISQMQLFQRKMIESCGERHVLLPGDEVGGGAESWVDAAQEVEDEGSL